MTKYDNTNNGALFKNTDKDHVRQPDYRGELNVAGAEYWLSAWLRESKKGTKYFSLAVQPKQPKVAAPDPGGARPSLKDELDDEIPF
jgi:hypothetical protein